MAEKEPTPAEIARDEKFIADLRRFGKPTPKQVAEAEKLKHGKKSGGKR